MTFSARILSVLFAAAAHTAMADPVVDPIKAPYKVLTSKTPEQLIADINHWSIQPWSDKVVDPLTDAEEFDVKDSVGTPTHKFNFIHRRKCHWSQHETS